jgi:hypothetical protein
MNTLAFKAHMPYKENNTHIQTLPLCCKTRYRNFTPTIDMHAYIRNNYLSGTVNLPDALFWRELELLLL